jgi:hypothetical protein
MPLAIADSGERVLLSERPNDGGTRFLAPQTPLGMTPFVMFRLGQAPLARC